MTQLNKIDIIGKIKNKFGDAILESHSFRDDDTVVIQKERLKDLCTFLKNDQELDFDYLLDVCGVDYLPDEPRFEVVYHMSSIARKHRLRVKTRVADGESVDSVTSVWPTADWTERETFDMFGIRFDGHPDLRRIYMADDWKGYPLRKDFPERGYKDEYQPFGEEE
ncbi:MAG: NADH-quinone oxidoreductase subunit C [Proteobacteria bacterium]|nr:NADH-quinone oxidoreductase subunit C [Pseudomonadota bacterium]